MLLGLRTDLGKVTPRMEKNVAVLEGFSFSLLFLRWGNPEVQNDSIAGVK
jgi:hypothetical protein